MPPNQGEAPPSSEVRAESSDVRHPAKPFAKLTPATDPRSFKVVPQFESPDPEYAKVAGSDRTLAPVPVPAPRRCASMLVTEPFGLIQYGRTTLLRDAKPSWNVPFAVIGEFTTMLSPTTLRFFCMSVPASVASPFA